ncbi:MAG: ATP-binding cassette domain-containing protein [Deltaproteobacteria bacterium]|nr:ATP-binding cassette domain-containing protein [Deltaproteobacteria bacterium]
MESLILAKELVKKFGPITAVDHVSFEVRKGECFGFLGPNGAGKTTTMRMVYGFSPPTAGALTVFGLSVEKSIREIKRRTGVVPQEDSLDPELTVLQNLLIYARYFDLPTDQARKRADDLLNFFQLKEKAKGEPDRLSGGMKRRLLIARALMNQPELLILDEPTTGLDPQSRHAMWDQIRALQKQGVTSILTTHYMEEAAQLCDRLVIMDHGKIIEEGRPQELVQKHATKDLEAVFLKLTGRELRE